MSLTNTNLVCGVQILRSACITHNVMLKGLGKASFTGRWDRVNSTFREYNLTAISNVPVFIQWGSQGGSNRNVGKAQETSQHTSVGFTS